MRLNGKKVYMRHSLIKKISLISLSSFLLVIIAVAFSYNDKTFLLRSRSVCKIKALAGTPGKNKIGSTPSILVTSPDLMAFCLSLTAAIRETRSTLISSQIAYIYPNRGSPVRS